MTKAMRYYLTELLLRASLECERNWQGRGRHAVGQWRPEASL